MDLQEESQEKSNFFAMAASENDDDLMDELDDGEAVAPMDMMCMSSAPAMAMA